VKEDNFDRQHLVDYNIDCFKEGTREIFQAKEKVQEESKTN
jgi:hypothetical protein